MIEYASPLFSLARLWTERLIGNLSVYCQAVLVVTFCAAPAWSTPIVLNVPNTAAPGNIVSLEGSGFGSSPKIYFRPFTSTTPIPVKIIKGDNNFVAFQVPKTQAFDVYYLAVSDGTSWSKTFGVNYPQAVQFDKPELAPNDRFRIFGRNLYMAPAPVSVMLGDQTTGAMIAATVDVSKSDPYSLTVIAPADIIPGHWYRAKVISGSNWTYTGDCVLARTANGDDHFQLNVPWGRDYVYQNGPSYNGAVDNADHHVFDVTNDPFITPHAKGDGVTDDQPAIQAAINFAAKHKGVVYLPAGTYRLASPSGSGLNMASNVVLQGHSATDTTILMGPSSAQPASYSFWGISWMAGATTSGLADLSVKNIDTRSQSVRNIVAPGSTSKLFLQRVNWDLGTGIFLSIKNADRLVIANSTFHQAINNQQPDPSRPGYSGVGPLWFENLTNFTFQNNTVRWASGGNAFLTLYDGVFEGNHFTRSAADKVTVTAANFSWYNADPQNAPIKIGDSVTRQLGRQIAVEFARNLVIQNNIFDVSDGEFKSNSNDGETINSEGGAYAKSQQDVGTVTAADTKTITANPKCAGTCAWNYFPASICNYASKIAIVSGKGAGQWRQITNLNNNTFTISAAWDIVPAPGDNFSIFVPSIENGLIRSNSMQDNPRGILLYASGFYNVSVVNNTLKDNGGIWLFGIQDTNALSYLHPKFGSFRNIEINGNSLLNTKGLRPAYIAVTSGMRDPNYIWGTAIDSIEIRNNSITGLPATPKVDYNDGYANNVLYADPDGPYLPGSLAYGVAGTILQGNNCTNCPVFYSLSTGVLDTIIWNSSINGALAGGTQTPSIYDQKIWNLAPPSTGTVVGHD
jgi:Pectate lyase superfamily protein